MIGNTKLCILFYNIHRPPNPHGFTVSLTDLVVVSRSHRLAAQTHGRQASPGTLFTRVQSNN